MLAPDEFTAKLEAFRALKASLDAGSARPVVSSGERLVSTGFAALDEALHGGFPRGAIATLEGRASSGRTAIAASLLATATGKGLAAAIDDGSLYPPTLAAAGVRLDRLLVVAVQNALG
ncbi:MAG: DNA recombination/repair protein RecA, partial [Candidatus Eremiobacteraeota bacterium]|nr:DNA recombination/repair protein RecA [Candidatus Eremiobacteraeota bacterium]